MVVVIDHHPRNREHREPQDEEIVTTMKEKDQGKEDGTRDLQSEVGNQEEKRMKKMMMMREWLTRTS